MDTKILCTLFALLTLLETSGAQVSSGNILQVLEDTPGLKKFGSWCRSASPGLYQGSGVLTVFAFNDTAYKYMPAQDRARLESMSLSEKQDYVETYTLVSRVSVDQMRDSSTQQSINGKELFINKRNRVYWNPGSTTGSTATYVNGAMIVHEQLVASNGFIHVLDRPLNFVSDKNVYQWLSSPDISSVQTTIFKELAERLYTDYYTTVIAPLATNDRVTFFLPSENALRRIPQSKLMGLSGVRLADVFEDITRYRKTTQFQKHPGFFITVWCSVSDYIMQIQPITNILWRDLMSKLYQDSRYYLDVVTPIARHDKITFFLPSETALRRIPAAKLQGLQGEKLANYFKMHYVLNRVIYTSYVEHQESYETADTGSRVLFVRQDAGRVMVKSGGVTAMIERGNITVRNGVIHIIDRMFGFVYNTAREQISQDAPYFNRLIDRVLPDLKTIITQSSGVNIFVPTDEAFTMVQNLRGVNFEGNNSLIDFIVRLGIVRDGGIEVSQINGNYDVRQRRYSRYNNWKLVIYNDRNETWVNGGNVRARIVRPDVKVTTGVLQYIDAVLGVPSKDIPNLIYYDDYLTYTYNALKQTGLDVYLRDQGFDASYLPQRTFDSYGNGVDNNNQQNQWPPQQSTQYPNQQQNPYSQTQNPYGQTQNPYGNQDPYGQTQNPYGNQDPYGQNQNQYQDSSYYGTCGNANSPCQFTFFVPNGTAIYNYYMTSLGYQITRDIPRFRYILRRHAIPNQLIFIENLPVSQQSYRYTTHTGEQITLRKETENTVRLSWGGMSARLLLWDLGATNGVVHIIDTVLSQLSDRDIDISASAALSANLCFFVFIACSLCLFQRLWR